MFYWPKDISKSYMPALNNSFHLIVSIANENEDIDIMNHMIDFEAPLSLIIFLLAASNYFFGKLPGPMISLADSDIFISSI